MMCAGQSVRRRSTVIHCLNNRFAVGKPHQQYRHVGRPDDPVVSGPSLVLCAVVGRFSARTDDWARRAYAPDTTGLGVHMRVTLLGSACICA